MARLQLAKQSIYIIANDKDATVYWTAGDMTWDKIHRADGAIKIPS